jgi:hypothetical protein
LENESTQQYYEPDVSIRLFGDDSMGIFEDNIIPLAQAQLNILNLPSNVGYDESEILYRSPKHCLKESTDSIKFWKNWEGVSNFK